MRITEICYGKNGNDLLFSFVLSTSELDSDYAIFFLNNEIKQYKSIKHYTIQYSLCVLFYSYMILSSTNRLPQPFHPIYI